jgi:transposase
MNGPYKGLKERVKENQRKLKQRLKEIDNKDVMRLEEKAEQWGKTLVDKNLLEKLKDFEYWKEWKHK